MNHKNIQNRIGRVAIIFWAVLLFLMMRYGWLQLAEGDTLAQRVKMQAGEERILQSPRGAILDTNGRQLAISVMTKSLYVDPNHVTDPQAVAEKLAPILGMTEQEILDDIAKGGGFVWVKRNMELEESEAVRKAIQEEGWTDCLAFQKEAKRFYPNDALAANVLGFVGADDVGLDGIEHQFDKLIKGENTEAFITTDIQNRPIMSSLFADNKYTGDRCKTIQLTLDSTIQFICEQALEKAMVDNKPQSATAIVMNPKTGEVLAMATRPTYNPNKFWESKPEAWKNPAVSSIYEPGSTFKSVVAGAALQEKVTSPNQVFVDPGYVMVSGRRIQNWNGESFGTVTFTDVVKNSLNTGFAQVGLALGAENLNKYARLFGFGEITGIELPAEESGILFNTDDMRDSDVATMSIGQSIAVTPIQLITAMSAIANDGVLLKPHIIKSVQNTDGSIYQEVKTEEVRRALDSATDKTLVGLLEQVVATGGGKKAGVKGYRIAGKTGTAQKIREDGAGYMDGRYIASFCGFAPVEDPRFTVLVIINDPQGIYYGGQIAAPVAAEIFSQLFRYMHIEPSSDPFSEMDKNAPKTRRTAKEQHREAPEGKVLVPDLIGKSIRQVSNELGDIGLHMDAAGSGIASSQSIPPFTVVDPGTSVTVYFKPED